MSRGSHPTYDLTRTILAVLCIGALIAATVWIVRPFVSAVLWAGTIVISTWPIMLRVQAKLGGRRGAATAVMTATLSLVLLVPVSVSAAVLIANLKNIVVRVQTLSELKLPPPPPWVERIPVQGPKVAAEWRQMSAEGSESVSKKLAPYAGRIVQWCIERIGGIGAMLVQFLLTLVVSAVLYVNGETAARGVRRFAYRLAGAHGERAAVLAAGTVRGVAMGVVVTAIVQAVVAGIGLFLARVPTPGLLTAAALLCCLVQIGPAPIMVPAVIWKYYSGDTVSGTVLLIFAILSMTIDNFIRPVLIRKGANLPLLLVIAGVIGGTLSFGIMGVFIGPAILAVTYVLLREWVEAAPDASADRQPAEMAVAASD